MTEKTKLNKWGVNAITSPFRWIIVTGIVYFVAAGEIYILRAWLYIGAYMVGSSIGSIVLVKNVPELLNQRGKMQKGTKKWDKIVIISYFLLAILVTPLIAGLDHRFQMSLLPFDFVYPGLGLYLISVVFSIWPMLHNPFFEGTVRIQKDRGHQVIASGPYAIVRHPGYLGMLGGSLPIPFVFGSIFSFIPAAMMVALVFFRTYLEDKTLHAELEGYNVYSQKVKHRLIPLIW